jgi:hypothetical protein
MKMKLGGENEKGKGHRHLIDSTRARLGSDGIGVLDGMGFNTTPGSYESCLLIR